MSRSVCIISPGHLSTNPRMVKEALTLQEAGWRVRVIHCRFRSWGSEADRSIAPQLHEVESVAFGPVEASRARYLVQGVRTRVARRLAGIGATAPRLLEAAHHPAVPELVREACRRPADLYIAHYVAALPAAARAARRHGAAYAFDAEDFHLGDLPDAPENEPERRVIHAIEGRYLPGATCVTAASPMIAEAYARSYGIETPTVLLNVFPKANAPAAPTPCGSAQPAPSIYWFSQTIGAGRGLETLLEAAGRARSRPSIHIRGTFAAGYRERLMRVAVEHGVDARIHFLEPALPDQLERLGAAYDLGYVGELAETANRRIALTNKLFSYLLGGVPVLASDIPAHRGMAEALGPAMALFPLRDPWALAAAIDGYLLHPDRLAAARGHAWMLGQTRYNWDVEKRSLLSLLRRHFGGRPASAPRGFLAGLRRS